MASDLSTNARKALGAYGKNAAAWEPGFATMRPHQSVYRPRDRTLLALLSSPRVKERTNAAASITGTSDGLANADTALTGYHDMIEDGNAQQFASAG